jgi:D-glycero-D-manno-heptose 1,7-bisphosphate phosphatase
VVGRRAVFLDRDGVLTVPEFRDGRSYAPKRLEDLEFYPDAAAGVTDLKSFGFLVIVATNQPDVGKGEVAETIVEAMHARLREAMPVDDIEVCYDTREAATERRKPGAGMLIDAARNWNIDLEASYVVGDRATDIEAGERAGCTTIFVDRGYSAEFRPTTQSATVPELSEAVRWIAAREQMKQAAQTQ